MRTRKPDTRQISPSDARASRAKSRLHRSFAALALTMLLTPIRVASADPDRFADGIKAYSKGDFTLAARCFLTELTTHRDNVSAFYYLGNTYMKLNRSAEAMDAYRSAVNIDPDCTAGKYSQTALDNLTPKCAPPPVTPKAQSNPMQTASLPAIDHDAMNDSAEMEKRATEIKEQAERQISQLQERMQNDVAALGRPLYARGRNYYMPDDSSVKSEYQSQINRVKEDSQRRLEELKKYYEARASGRHH